MSHLAIKARDLARGIRLGAITAFTPLVLLSALSVACTDEESGTEPPAHTHTVAAVSVVPVSVTLKAGETAVLTGTAACGCGYVMDTPIDFSSQDATIATVSPAGIVTAVSMGNTTVDATAAGKVTSAAVTVQPTGTAVGPAGGTVVTTDGAVEVEIPAGALEVVTDVIIVAADDAAFVGDPLYIAGTAYELKPQGLQLRERARLRIRFDPNEVPAGTFHEQLRIRERDGNLNQWRETQQNKLQQNVMEGEIEQFGVYAIVIQPAVGTMIGAAGGTVASADGNAVLEIPPGALSAPVDITVLKATDSEFVPDPLFVPGTAYEILPDGVELRTQARLRIRFDPNDVPPGLDHDRLRLRERDRLRNRWRDPAACTLNQYTLEVGIERFGLFAIIASPKPPPVVGSVTVSPALLNFEEGDVIQMYAEVLDTEGNPVVRDVTWVSSNPAVAVVDENGLVTAVAEGSAVISAVVDAVTGSAPVNVKKKGPPPARIVVSPSSASLSVGETVQLTAVVYDADDNIMNRSVTWSSGSTSIATVGGAGLVTAVSAGTAVITAKTQNVSGTATITVNPPVTTVVIDPVGHEPIEIGLTRQLTATAYDIAGQPVMVQFDWASSNTAIATVDANGLVTGTGRGTATITASVGAASDAVDIRVVGEATAFGNNLSYPVVFADGVGITGLPAASDPGLRPLATENITVGTLPFFWTGNTPTYGAYYEQQTFNTWQAEWMDGSGQPKFDAEIFWGDNLTHQTWSATRPIRVEQVLYATGVGTLAGFNMTYLYGEGPEEMQGADESTGDFTPTVYTTGSQLIVEKLSGPGGAVVATVMTTAISSEVNVGGKIIYGTNLRLSDWTPPSGTTYEGWYRLTFRLASGANCTLTAVGNTEGTYLPGFSAGESWLEIYINP
jgi:uncharacterized protein YjdB